MKKIALIIAVLASAIFVSVAAASGGIKYKYIVPTNLGRAFAKGAHQPLRKCAFIKQHRIFGCKVSAHFAIFLTHPGLYKYTAYRVVNGKITKIINLQVPSGQTA